MKKLLLLLPFFFLANCTQKESKLVLPALIADNMVLQQNSDAFLWGWSNPGNTITINASWNATGKTKADKTGKWKVSIKTPEFGGPYKIEINTKEKSLVVENVMIGEVWLCSGQSNMEMPMKGWPPNDLIDNYQEEIANGNYANIRMFTVQRALSVIPKETCSGEWEICSPETVGDFSATAYYFGLSLFEQLNVPVGLIHSSWGGTPAESWTSAEHLKSVPEYNSIDQELKIAAEEFKGYQSKLSELKTISFTDLPAENPFENLDLNDISFIEAQNDYTNWKEMQIPKFWEETELPNFDGVVWLQTEFEIPENIYPEGFELYLGPVDDMDATYVNGVKIGSNEVAGVWRKERKYSIPESILKKGKNIALVKVTDTGGGGGIYGSKSPAIYKGLKKIIDLAGRWKYKPAAIFIDNSVCVFDDAKTSYEDLPQLKYQLNSQTPTMLYNAMIAPLIPYTIKGVTWYQGEANVGRGEQYKTIFPTMISSWREVWQQGNYPFYYVQIAPFDYGPESDNDVALLREAQLETLSQVNVGMVVTMDIGNPTNIHPGNKKDVGDRLARWALSKTYDLEDISCSGPILKEAKFENTQAKLYFDYAEKGLILSSSESFFEIAGENEVFHKATAEIDGNTIVLKSIEVSTPTMVRYAWGDDVEPNLFNTEGLPASPFRAHKNF